MSSAAQQHQQATLTFTNDTHTNGLSWSRRAPYRVAVGSFESTYSNAINIIQRDMATDELFLVGTVEHYYPPTKLQFSPSVGTPGVDDGRHTDHMVTSGDYLRFWTLTDGPASQQTATSAAAAGDTSSTVGSHPDQRAHGDAEPSPAPDTMGRSTAMDNATLAARAALRRSTEIAVERRLEHTFKHSTRPGVSEDFCAPVTSFDWSAEDPRLVAACSIDTTVTVWDVQTYEVTVHLIAHDKEVFDVAFQARQTHNFATCGADGSVRLFDTRKMDSCTVVYESPTAKPMMRIGWNLQDTNYLAAISAEASEVVVFDVRYPSHTAAHLRGTHTAPLNSFAWAPHASSAICTAGEDHRAVLWDLHDVTTNGEQASKGVVYDAPGPINCVAWYPNAEYNWVAISFADKVQMLLV